MSKRKELFGLAEADIDAITLLSSQAKLKGEDAKKVQDFFAKILGNSAYNKLFSKALERNDLTAAERDTIKSLRYLSFKTKDIAEFPEVIRRATRNMDKIKSDVEIAEEDKLTLHELGQLKTIKDLGKVLKPLADRVVLPSKVQDLYGFSITAQNILRDVDKDLGVEPSDIVMYGFERQFFLKNKRTDAEEKFTQHLVSKFSHAAQAFKAVDGSLRLTHVWDKYQTDPLTIAEVSYSDIYRINPAKLVSSEARKAWEAKHPGEDFDKKIREQFQGLHNKLHRESQQKFKHISNGEFRRFKAGLADLGIFGAHRGWGEEERRSMFDNGKIEDEMICSEFVSRSLVSSMMELNKELQTELGIKDAVVKLPFDPRERLEKIHPQRLVDLCAAQGLVEKVELSPAAQAFVSQNVKKQRKFHAVACDLKKDDIGLIMHKKEKLSKKLEKLKESLPKEEDRKSVDVILNHMDDLSKKQEYGTLHKIVDKFLDIFKRMVGKTTEQQLQGAILKACDEVKTTIQTVQKKSFVERLKEQRKQVLGTTQGK